MEPDWDGLVVKTTRYFGGMPDLWETALTLRLHRAHERELALRPPTEAFLAAYFEAQGWWRAPRDRADHTSETALCSDLPEFEA